MVNLPEGVQQQVSLAKFSTLGIGGPARYFCTATDAATVAKMVQWARAERLTLFVLGGGSNVLIADQGFSGLVLQIDLRGITAEITGQDVLVTAAAGEDWDQFVAYTVNNNWSGLECLSGIPGRVGATPIQNVGAYGQEVRETITEVSAYDREQDQIVTLTNAQCQFSYRNSIFKSTLPDRYIVLGVTYRLTVNNAPAIRYPELQKYLTEQAPTRLLSEVTLAETRAAVLTIRTKKSMVLNADDIDSHSVGSFFVNPVITSAEFGELVVKLQASGEITGLDQVPNFPAGGNRVKLSAAWLIERAGFRRGYRHGNVGLSSKHALAIINRGGGSAREVLTLARMIETGVATKFSIKLHHEPVYVGF